MTNKAQATQPCLSDTEVQLLASFPSDPRCAILSAHLLVCDDCAHRFEEYLYKDCTALLSDEERKAIRNFVESRCKPYDPSRKLKLWCLMHPPVPRTFGGIPVQDQRNWRRAAAGEGQLGQRKTSSEDSVSMVFLSQDADNQASSWRATLTLPGAPDSETRMEVNVSKRDGTPAEGVFTVCGITIPLADGAGTLLYRDFIKGIKTGEAYLTLPDKTRIPFVLTLF